MWKAPCAQIPRFMKSSAFSLFPCPCGLRGLYRRVEGQRIWRRQCLPGARSRRMKPVTSCFTTGCAATISRESRQPQLLGIPLHGEPLRYGTKLDTPPYLSCLPWLVGHRRTSWRTSSSQSPNTSRMPMNAEENRLVCFWGPLVFALVWQTPEQSLPFWSLSYHLSYHLATTTNVRQRPKAMPFTHNSQK